MILSNNTPRTPRTQYTPRIPHAHHAQILARQKGAFLSPHSPHSPRLLCSPSHAYTSANHWRRRVFLGASGLLLCASFCVLLFVSLCAFAASAMAEEIALSNNAGVKVTLKTGKTGWVLDSITYHGKPVGERLGCLLYPRNVRTGECFGIGANEAKKIDEQTAELTGETKLYNVPFSFRYKIVLDKEKPVVSFTPSWKVAKDVHGWEIGTHIFNISPKEDWRVQHYPFAGNSERLDLNPMRYCGVPGVLLYKPDLSLTVLFAIDSRSDYLNPTTWTGDTRFLFSSKKMPPIFFHCGGKLSASVDYKMPLQLFLDDTGKFTTAITNIVKNWMQAVDYKVEPLHVRTPQEAFDLSVAGRKAMSIYNAGKGYEHHAGTPFIYVGNNPYIAYYEYLTYCLNGDKLWRDRAFEQIDFLLKGQLPNGCFHTSYNIKNRGARPEQKTGQFCSWDWGHNGYKVDINVYAARFILQMWQKVKEKEGIDKKDWYAAAVKSLDWAMRQQNKDGGFPQCVDVLNNGKEGKKSLSVVSGRTMVALPIVAKITGNDFYLKKAEEAEKFMREKVENRFWFTGMHPDLPPEDFEQDSLYAVVEYWLGKYERTQNAEALEHAVANAHLALLFWCPKQLSWVRKPTQLAHSEQQHYNQYSVYSYGNRKVQSLDRLFKATKNPLFEQLRDRVMQNIFFTQVASGPYKGGVRDAIADPWLERKSDFDFSTHRTPYTSELVADIMIDLIELGKVK
jgi:hypothetical protein